MASIFSSSSAVLETTESAASFRSDVIKENFLRRLTRILSLGLSSGRDINLSISVFWSKVTNSSSVVSARLAVQEKLLSRERLHGSGRIVRYESWSLWCWESPRNLQTCDELGAMVSLVVQAIFGSLSICSLLSSRTVRPVWL